LIDLIIAVLSMLAIGPLTAPSVLPQADRGPAAGIGAADGAIVATASIDNTVLAPASTGDATSAAASSTPSAEMAPVHQHTEIELPVYKLVGPERKLDRYMNLAAKRLDPRMQGALSHIVDDGRRLLALKYYSRRRGNIDSRWALSSNQIVRHRGSKEHKTAVALVEAIKLRFSTDNPGYHLKVNTDVRSLEKQIEIWNTFASTKSSGEVMLKRAETALANDNAWPEEPTEKDIARFTSLVASTGVRSPTAAVPGLSLHGTGRAFDFIIYKGDEIVAGAVAETVGTVWDKAGWTTKLKEAITAVSPRFDGPLRGPYEPWHYNYMP
jgi:hypothetical protein